MPNEPNSPIEQQLKAYADERRKQAGEPFTLPPHTRHVLRDHVDRFSSRLEVEELGAAERWWRWFWPFLGLGASAFAAFAVFLTIWREQHPEPAPKQVAAVVEKAVEESEMDRKADEEMPSLASTDKPSEVSDKLPSPSAEHVSPDFPPVAAPALALAAAVPAGSTVASVSVTPQAMVARTAEPPALGPVADGLAPSSAPASPAFGVPPQEPANASLALTSRPAPVPDAAAGVAVDGARDRSVEPLAAVAPQAVLASNFPAQAHSVSSATKGVVTAAAAPQGREASRGDRGLASIQNVTGNYANQLGQRYVQSQPAKDWRRNLNSPPRSAVLNSFVLQPKGDRFQVIDEDGSVYEGTVRSAAEALPRVSPSRGEPVSTVRSLTAQKTGQAGRAADAASKAVRMSEKGPTQVQQGEPLAQNQVLFRAVGTNRSSRQKVVFDGRLVLTNVPAATGLSQQQSASQQQNAPRQQTISQSGANAFQEMLFNNAAVQGRVTIGGRTQVEINAVQAPR